MITITSHCCFLLS